MHNRATQSRRIKQLLFEFLLLSNCEEQLPSTDSRPTVGQQFADSWPTLNRQATNR